MKKQKDNFIRRRGELFAELFLQELNPFFILSQQVDSSYDFLVGFPNPYGGINNYTVEVKSTECHVGSEYRLNAKQYEILANSNIPALLLVVDVKENKIFYSLVIPYAEKVKSSTIAVPVIEITDAVKKELQQQLQRGPMELHPAMNLQQAERPAHP